MRALLALFFGKVVALRNWAFDRKILGVRKLPGRVISVGNIAVGGTGKSPAVIFVAEELIKRRLRPAILTRGYRGGLKSSEWLVLLNGQRMGGNATNSARPDEAIMQSRALPSVPVIVGARRYRAAMTWLEQVNEGARPTHWILDDGFQHRQIHRDVDIVLLDAEKPFGPLLPAGLFRESYLALKRAQEVVFTRCSTLVPGQGDETLVSMAAPGAHVQKAKFVVEPPKLVGGGAGAVTQYLAVAGIAKPSDFLASVRACGLQIGGELLVADHGSIREHDMRNALGASRGIVTTEKDWARAEGAFLALGIPIYVLPVKMRFEVPIV